jgi:hypothetical protein
MGTTFSDITLYIPTPHPVGSPDYITDTSLQNFVSDLYVQKMYGYKPPKISRITIQPEYHDDWKQTWRNGSIVAIAPYFSYKKYAEFEKAEKYRYILDLIQEATLQLSDEYKWEKLVFEKAYKEVIESNFAFKIDYPSKKSKDKGKAANLFIEKTETITSVNINLETSGSNYKIKLFEKRNMWWYDCTYLLARHSKWFDENRFGIYYQKGEIVIWYSLEKTK